MGRALIPRTSHRNSAEPVGSSDSHEDGPTGLKRDPKQGLKPEQGTQLMHFIPGITDNPVVVAVKAALSNHRAAQCRQVGFVLLCY